MVMGNESKHDQYDLSKIVTYLTNWPHCLLCWLFGVTLCALEINFAASLVMYDIRGAKNRSMSSTFASWSKMFWQYYFFDFCIDGSARLVVPLILSSSQTELNWENAECSFRCCKKPSVKLDKSDEQCSPFVAVCCCVVFSVHGR